MPAAIPGLVDRLKRGDWLTRPRVIAYGAILLALEIVTFLFLVAGTHGWIVPLDRPTTTDFASFYAAGSLADAGTPELAYDQAAHLQAEEQATSPGVRYQFFFYPPVFMLLCAPLAHLPYLLAFILFEAATLVPCLFVARAILREQKDWTALLPLLAFPAVFWTIGLGQNAFLTAALFGGATLLIDRRPMLAGLLFGALCYKPHFGLLVPVALIAGGRWRAVAAAAASVAALCLLSLGLFGWEAWRDYLTIAAGSHVTYQSGRIDLAGLISAFAGVRLLGGSIPLAYTVQGAAGVTAAAIVAFVWHRNPSLEARAATLAAATLVAIPVVLIYDLTLGGIAMAWLVRAGRESGFLPWEKTAFVGLFALAMLSRSLSTATHVPLAQFGTLLLLGFATACAWREIAQQGSAVKPAIA